MLAPHSSAALEFAKRRCVLAEILAFLGERVTQLDLAAPIGADVTEPCAQFADVIVRERLYSQLAAITVRFVVFRLERNDTIVIALGSRKVTDKSPCSGPIEQEVRLLRCERDGRIVGGECAPLIVRTAQERANGIEQRCIRTGRALRGERRRASLRPAPERQQALRALQQQSRIGGLA
jgi:hypothetical protein